MTHGFQIIYKNNENWPVHSTRENNVCRVLILDSSFNPPTKAHANLIDNSLEHYPKHHFDASLLLLSTRNVDKTLTGASVSQRLEMMQIMTSGYDGMAVALTDQGKFVDKATQIQDWRKELKLELYFIMGYDTIVRLLEPKYYLPTPLTDALGPFLSQCVLICADRGESKDGFWESVSEQFGNGIQRIRLDPKLEVLSSTLARSMIKNKESSLDSVMSTKVVSFIHENQIYTE